MTRSRGDVREAKFPEKRSDVALAIIDAEPFGDDVLEVNTTPTNDPFDFSVGAHFDNPGELRFLGCRQARRRPACPIVEKPIRAGLIEPVAPVTQGLAVHAADYGSLGTAHSVKNGRQRQQSPALVGVLGFLGQTPKLAGRKIRP